MGGDFNQHIDNLPENLQKLVFAFGDFDKGVYNLPKAVTILRLRTNFQQPIDYLPFALTRLTVGMFFTVEHLLILFL